MKKSWIGLSTLAVALAAGIALEAQELRKAAAPPTRICWIDDGTQVRVTGKAKPCEGNPACVRYTDTTGNPATKCETGLPGGQFDVTFTPQRPSKADFGCNVTPNLQMWLSAFQNQQ